MRRGKNINLIATLLLFNSCSVNLLPPLDSPESLTLTVPGVKESRVGSKFKEISPTYLSGVFISQPYRSSKIYSCREDESLSNSGYEWVGSFESQFESELDRFLRETYPNLGFVSKESGAYSRSDLSIKVYRFCLNDSASGRELRLKMLVSLTPSQEKVQLSKQFDLSFKDDSSASMSEFLNRGFGYFFKDMINWLDQ